MNKELLINIVLLIHMALTGIMLFRLFKLKNATGGQLILTFLALAIPVLGPSLLIVYYNKIAKQQQATPIKKNTYTSTSKRKK